MKKISIIAAVLSSVGLPLSVQAALTFQTAEPTSVTFAGKTTFPQFRMSWNWGTNNVTGLDAQITELVGRELTIKTLPVTTLLMGYTPFGIQSADSKLMYPIVTWGAGATSEVVGLNKFVRKITLPVTAPGSAVAIGRAEIFATGVSSMMGNHQAYGPGAPNPAGVYYVVGTRDNNNSSQTLCGEVAGSSGGVAGSFGTVAALPADFLIGLDKINILGTAAAIPGAPFPQPAVAFDYLNTNSRHVVEAAGLTYVPPTGKFNIEKNNDGVIFRSGVTVVNSTVAAEFRCGLGFTGSADESIKLTFNAGVDLTNTLQWEVKINPTVTYL